VFGVALRVVPGVVPGVVLGLLFRSANAAPAHINAAAAIIKTLLSMASSSVGNI
jgi:hypothetical protein